MQFDSNLNPERKVPALIGNGTLVTFLGECGFHEGGEVWARDFEEIQEFVMAGRRHPGPHHRLISFGNLKREIWIDGTEPRLLQQESAIVADVAEYRSKRQYQSVLETTKSLVLFHKNVFFAETRISNQSNEDVSVLWTVRLQFGDRAPKINSVANGNGAISIEFETFDNLGQIHLCTAGAKWVTDSDHAVLALNRYLEPGEEAVVRLAISISDRIQFVSQMDMENWDEEINQHRENWNDFWQESEVSTGNSRIDSFREICLYAIRSQATPWSIPPSVSEKHWGAGAFHDEYYPFMALLTGGHRELAKRITNFRLLNLEKAKQKAIGNGALFPWSSTEFGDERDPHGHWYSERFHLGQIALCAWNLWLADRKLETLEWVYPIIRETASYFQFQMLERDERGNLFTKSCTDFDESVGEVKAGPMTMAAACFCLDRAHEAARRLGVDREIRQTWESLSQELRRNFFVDLEKKIYSVPAAKHFHISTLGYVVPFACDEGSEFAKNTAKIAHQKLQNENGFRPGFSPAFDGTSWLWTAGHLAMVHTALGDGSRAWEAIENGIQSSGQFLSPNEHLNHCEVPIVPWFTTGCGAWVAAYHQMFARFTDDGDYLLSAIPENLTTFSFRGLAFSRNVSVSAKVNEGELLFLSFLSEFAITFDFEIPTRFVERSWPNAVGKMTDLGTSWRIQLDLMPGENRLLG